MKMEKNRIVSIALTIPRKEKGIKNATIKYSKMGYKNLSIEIKF